MTGDFCGFKFLYRCGRKKNIWCVLRVKLPFSNSSCLLWRGPKRGLSFFSVDNLLFSLLVINRAPWTRIVSWSRIQTTVEEEAFNVLYSVPGPTYTQNFKNFDTYSCEVQQWNWKISRQSNPLFKCWATNRQMEMPCLTLFRILGKLGRKISTLTFVFKTIFILRCMCYSTSLPETFFIFVRLAFVHFATYPNYETEIIFS